MTDQPSVSSSVGYPIIKRTEIDLGSQLDAGAYSAVYRGTWRSPKGNLTVALKKVFVLEREADILSRIRHRNIIRFYGVCPTNPDFYIITEFAENGSLYGQLHSAKNDSIVNFPTILDWATQIARGVYYLHYDAQDTIIHRDLKSKNIVLDDQMCCKICDFGTSKNLTHSCTVPSWGGTAAWMSPEIIRQKEGITPASDVWSFAVVLWEMLSREVPYSGFTEFKIYSLIEQGVRLVIPDCCPTPLKDLLLNCWHSNARERLTMKNILEQLLEMGSNRVLNEACIDFMQNRRQWKCEIERQMDQLKTIEVTLQKKSEELLRRERALETRENDQALSRVLRLSSIPTGDVTLWDEMAVATWVQGIAKTILVDEVAVFQLCKRMIDCGITGRRLLDLTPRDLQNLGLKSEFQMKAIFHQVVNLRKENHRLQNFPPLVNTTKSERIVVDQNKAKPLGFDIIFYVYMMCRSCEFDDALRHRFKVLIDSDWQESYLVGDLPKDLDDTQALIKEVCISVLNEAKQPVRDASRRHRDGLPLTEWMDAPKNERETMQIKAVITFTGRVLQPRNCKIEAMIARFDVSDCLASKTVHLTVRPVEETPSRVSFTSPREEELRGFWRERSLQNSTSQSPQLLSPKPYIWSNGTINLSHPLIKTSTSTPDAVDGFVHSHSLQPPSRSISDNRSSVDQREASPRSSLKRTRRKATETKRKQRADSRALLSNQGKNDRLDDSVAEKQSSDSQEKMLGDIVQELANLEVEDGVDDQSNIDDRTIGHPRTMGNSRRRRRHHHRRKIADEGAVVIDGMASPVESQPNVTISSSQVHGGNSKWAWKL